MDLYVANYVDFTLANHHFCGNEKAGIPGYCHPDSFNGQSDHFYRNLGAGRFLDETEAAGFGTANQAGLGVVFFDLDEDLFPDLYIANDLDPNLLFHNQGDGAFEDISLLSGTGYSNVGKPEAGMGVEAADLDGDGQIDLVVTNFALETNAYYRNAGQGLFIDSRFSANLGEPSLLYLGFGVAAMDLDHDRDLDLVIANGHILDNAEQLSAVKAFAQRNQVMENLGSGQFRELENTGLDAVRVSRGLAAGDLDGDGDLDLVISNSNQRAEVYENLAGSDSGGWLLVDLRGGVSNRYGIGARLELASQGTTQVRELRTASSYLSQNALSAHFGLGSSEEATLTVRWPSGKVQVLRSVPPNHRLHVME